MIEKTTETISFDATSFKPMIMPTSAFSVQPANKMISTYSAWTMQLDVNIPMQENCYIKIWIPPELTYNV